jgi:hypothetical protein
MEICFVVGGKKHCYWIPIYVWPPIIIKGPGPVNYQELVADASVLGSIQELTKSVGDAGVRSALQSGVAEAVKAMQKRAGAEVTVSLSQRQ